MTLQTWVLAAVAALFVTELVQGRHRGVHRLQDGFLVASALISSFALRPVLAMLTAFVIGLLLPQWKGTLSGAPILASFLVLLVSAEFAQYWVHRWAHDSIGHKLLYGMHRTHHSAPYVNVTLLFRSNVFWGFVHPYNWLAALAIYLGQIEAAGLFFLMMLLWNGITHSDWRWDDAIIAHVPGGARLVEVFELCFVTPRIHHVHHGYGRDGKAYRNFNTMLTVFDRIFGTLHIPAGRPWRYGVPGGEHHWVRQILFPLVPLGKAVRRDRLGRRLVEPMPPETPRR
ncbi:sterol desaturase family protein [Rhizorhapis sp. SPR117]|uniref:sterol desaturase family protein n=1 Tax=Rhizorhapis sp. SPR117 TaxID=2912611 RepID=UPI001F28F266|nr:sterol desaturase family protein [Rhizorhapis sp. SPR117]